jgi:CubicO group peptidase (beta-lactamase class C family)
VGQTYEYSNSNYQILGLIIQQVSGQPFETYLQTHIFEPLDMKQAYASPLEAQQHGLATGYRYWFGLPLADTTPFDRGGLPSGFLMGSAEDLAHFLIAHLNQGRYGNVSLVSAQGMAELLAPAGHKAGGEEDYAMDWGILKVDGEPWLVKGGDLADFKTQVVLVPGQHLGIVTLINANDSLSSFLGDTRLPYIPLQVTRLVLDQPLAEVSSSPLPLLFRGLPIAILLGQTLGSFGSLRALRSWHKDPQRRPRNWRAKVWQIGAPVLVSLVLAWLAVVGVPQIFHLPLSFLLYETPDFGYGLVVIGIVGLGWALIWPSLVGLTLASIRRAFQPETKVARLESTPAAPVAPPFDR